MTVVVHDTPGLIDVRSFTTFGVNAKPRVASPIGFFGTGLKYAVAVLVRMGAEVTVWIGEKPHVFFTEPTRFRDREFSLVRMRRRRGVTARWFAEDLPFTTELGKNWEPWMALRELHSNTLDEDGSSYAWEHDVSQDNAYAPKGASDRTRVVVRSPAYAEAFSRLGEVFLPEADRSRRSGTQIVRRPSEHLFYRGLRAMKPPKPTLVTWCVFGALDLTEDRTVSNPWLAQTHCMTEVMRSTDREMIRDVLNAPPTTWESDFPWNSLTHVAGSAEFKAEAADARNPRATRWYVGAHPTARETLDWRLRVAISAESDDEEAYAKVAWRWKSAIARELRASLERERPSDSPTEDLAF